MERGAECLKRCDARLEMSSFYVSVSFYLTFVVAYFKLKMKDFDG